MSLAGMLVEPNRKRDSGVKPKIYIYFTLKTKTKMQPKVSSWGRK